MLIQRGLAYPDNIVANLDPNAGVQGACVDDLVELVLKQQSLVWNGDIEVDSWWW